MSHSFAQRLSEEREQIVSYIETVLSEADSQSRDLVETEQRALDENRNRLQDIDKQLEKVSEFLKAREAAVHIEKIASSAETRGSVYTAPRGGESLGSMWTSSDQYRNWDGVGSTGLYTAPVSIDQLRAPILTTTAPVGTALMPTPEKIRVPQGSVSNTLLDNVGRLNASSNSVELVVYGTPEGAQGFDVVPEGDLKPEVTVTASVENVTLRQLAGWLKISRAALADSAMAASFLDNQLRVGLLRRIEKEISDTLVAGTYSDETGAAGQPLLEVVRMAMAKVEEQGFSPTTVLLNPADAAAIDLSVMSSTLLGPVFGASIYNLRTLTVNSIPAGTAYVGDLSTAVQYIARDGVQIFSTDSDGPDDFRRNIITLLCETRGRAAVTQSNALVKAVATTVKSGK